MRGLVVLLTVMFMIAAGYRVVEGALAEPTTGSANCVGAVAPIDATDCMFDPPDPNVDELGHDVYYKPRACENPQLRLEDARYADVGGGQLTCP